MSWAGQSGVRYVASGCIRVGSGEMAGRLLEIHRHVTELVNTYAPGEVAIERVFMHRNPDSALKLGQARGAALCGACHAGAEVFEYAPRIAARRSSRRASSFGMLKPLGRGS